MTENPYLQPPLPNYETQQGFEWTNTDQMSESEVREEIQLLREAVKKHSKLYYEEFNPVIADRVYDELFSRLEHLEEELGVEDEESPTNRVGTDISGTTD